MVQHATIGPPFLDETTVVDSNAQKGFMQLSPLPNPEQPEIRWPEAIKEGQPVDLRRLDHRSGSELDLFCHRRRFGWVTAHECFEGIAHRLYLQDGGLSMAQYLA